MKFLFVFIFGAVVGSFLNVCIYRIPRGKSILWPGSRCPDCDSPIRPFDNIPLVSFLLLRAKCRDCGHKIPLRYFFVELITAVSGVVLLFHFPANRAFFIYWFFACILIVVVFIDIEHRVIPDIFSIPGIFAGMIFSAFFLSTAVGFSGERFIASLLGVFTGAGSMFLMGFLGELAFHRQALGGGDIKLMAMIGAFIGWKLVLLVFFMAPVLGVGFALFARLKKGDKEIPYAPYLALGALISLLYGDEVLRYLFPVL